MSGVIHYVNPRACPGGEWQCAVCGSVFDDYDRARECAESDHARKATP